jgi:hypothetical protein
MLDYFKDLTEEEHQLKSETSVLHIIHNSSQFSSKFNNF